jgi:MYXO-CTERM domain-containing protein
VFFVSPRAFTSSGAQTELPPPTFDNAVYSPHFYDGGVLLFDSWSGLQPDEAFGFMTSKASEWNVPFFLGEFGAPAGTERGLDYVDMLYDRLDEGFFSSAHWVYTPGWTADKKDGWNLEDLSIVDDGGHLRDNFRVRPHPRRVAGEPVRFSVTHEPPTLELAWEHDPALGSTVAFVPWDAWLGGLPSVEAEGAECTIDADLLVCASAQKGPASVTVRRGEAPAPAPGGCSMAPTAEEQWVGFVALGALGAAASRRRRQKGARRRVSLGRATTTGSTTTKP